MNEIILETKRGKIAARSWGEGQPVLALHGWLDNANSFKTLAPLLRGVRLVAPDFPGHGKSFHRPEGMTYHFIDFVQDVEQIVRALDWKCFSIVGHSMGGAIAVLYTATFPSLVDKLVLLESLGPMTEPAEKAPSRMRAFFDEWRKLEGKAPPVYPSEERPTKLKERTGIDERGARLLVERSLKPVSGGWTWSSDPRARLPSMIRLSEEQVETFLAQIKCPVLGIKATQGMTWHLNVLKKRLSLLENCRVVEVEGRHHVHLDHPDRVAQHLSEFLAK